MSTFRPPSRKCMFFHAIARSSGAAAGVCLFVLAAFQPAPAHAATPEDCAAAISRSASRYESAIHKALADCSVKTATGSACDASKRDDKTSRAADRLGTGVASCTEEDL